MRRQQQEKKESNDFIVPNYTRLLSHFKNSLYEGFFQTNSPHREGPGITLMDNTSCIVGNYRNDQLNGQTLLFLSFDTYAIAEFNKGMLDGSFVIRSPKITIYSQIKSNKIDGEILIINYEQLRAQLWTIEADGIGQLHNQLQLDEILYSLEDIAMQNQGNSIIIDRIKNLNHENQILKSLAPYIQKAPSVSEFLKNFKFYGGKKEIDLMPGFTHRVFKQNQMIYLADQKGNQDNFLGIALNKKEQIISIGSFSRINKTGSEKSSNIISFENLYFLNGLGVTISSYNPKNRDSKVIEAGEFVNGLLNGDGYKEIVGDRSIFGKFLKGQIRQIDMLKTSSDGDEEAKRLYYKRVKSVHIHSLSFINNYANERPIFILKNLYKMVTLTQSYHQTNEE